MAKAPALAAKKTDDDLDEGAETAESSAPVKSRMPGKKIIMFFVLPALVLLIASGLGAYYFGVLTTDETAESGKDGEHAEAAVVPAVVFYDLPEILVNLNSQGKKEAYLKIRISLELENAEAPAAIEPLIPRVIDNFQVFLREMRPEDLSGSTGMIRLKEELMRRINLSVQPIKVRDVLFKEMLVQ